MTHSLPQVAAQREIPLIQSFEPSADTFAAEAALDAQLSTLIQDFLSQTGISTDTDLTTLILEFRNSQIPAAPIAIQDYVDPLSEQVLPHCINTASPRFIGHMTTALPYFVRSLSKLVTALNQNMVKVETSKALSLLEREALAMLHRLIYHQPGSFYEQHIHRSDSTLGILTSGGTIANLTALWCARNACFAPHADFAGVEQEGLAAALQFYGYQGVAVIGSRLMHYSFDKAADLLGIGSHNLIKVPVDDRNRVDLAALKDAIATCQAQQKRVIALVGIAGTTDAGSIDPLAEMAAIAQSARIHFHVDAAWGGPLLFSQQHAHKLAGIAQADSVTIDGHKQLYLPMGLGMVLLRRPDLASAIEKQAQYIVRAGSLDLGKRSLEGSRASMVLFLHAALNLIGQAGYEGLINRGMQRSQEMAKLIGDRAEFELLAEPETNILLYRYIPDPWRTPTRHQTLTPSDQQSINQFNQALQQAQFTAGRSFVSRTTVTTAHYGAEPITALRIVLANPLTTPADLEAVLEDQIQIAKSLPLPCPTRAAPLIPH